MMRLWPLLGVSALLAVLAFACSGNGADQTPTSAPSPASPAATACPSPSGTPPQPATKTYQERPAMSIDPAKKYTAIVKTVRGDLAIELLPDIATETVNSFVFLARDGYYDGVTFHRVIRDVPGQPDFVAQGGDPTGTGSGGPGYTLPDEFSDVPFERGTVGMARTNDPNSAGSQFFIAYDDQPGLNGQFTVFGQVVEGMDVVDCLTPRDPATNLSAPPGDAIISIEIEEG